MCAFRSCLAATPILSGACFCLTIQKNDEAAHFFIQLNEKIRDPNEAHQVDTENGVNPVQYASGMYMEPGSRSYSDLSGTVTLGKPGMHLVTDRKSVV